ncbi:MAG: electron transfer flavoprotein subunit beta/FixA family protein, partial [Chitinophagaceae bacterium]
TGKETIDYNGAGVGGMIAGILDLPFISLATKLETDGKGETEFYREIEGGEEICSVKLPAVVSCMKGMAEQRIPNMRGIMAARTKPLKVLEPADGEKLTEIIGFEIPVAKTGIKMINPDNVEELVRLLHEEAKVI